MVIRRFRAGLDGPSGRRQLSSLSAVVGVTVLGLVVRLLLFPPPYALPGVDELGYAAEGLLLLEGVTPGYKFAPAAVTTWVGFLFGAFGSVLYLFDPTVIGQSASLLIRPLFALDAALFTIYADMSGLRLALQITSLAISLLGIAAAALIGRHYGDWPGALLSGGLMALVPMVALESVTSRPYAAAWSLAVVSIAAMVALRGRRRWGIAGICLGLAIASRIEMILLVPLLGWSAWSTEDPEDRTVVLARTGGVAALTFLVAAPWFVTHLVGNVRKVVTVKLLAPEGWNFPELLRGLNAEGLGIAMVLIPVGLLLRARRERGLVLGGLALLILVIVSAGRPSSGGLRHQGDLFVLLVVLGAYALAGVSALRGADERDRLLEGAVAIAVLTFPLFRTVETIDTTRSGWVDHDVVGWIEEHVPEGTPVFFNGLIIHAPTKVPLPTQASADRVWEALIEPNAWRRKFRERIRSADIRVEKVPRALSMEHMYQQLGAERRYFILGGEGVGSQRPRYELFIGTSPDLTRPETQAFIREFERIGGIFLRFGDPVEYLGTPVKSWVASDGSGVFVYRRRAHGM